MFEDTINTIRISKPQKNVPANKNNRASAVDLGCIHATPVKWYAHAHNILPSRAVH